MLKKYDVLVLAARGLSEVCLEEVHDLSENLGQGQIAEIEPDFGGVHCEATFKGIALLNLCLRTASRVLIRLIEGVKVENEEDIRMQVAKARIHTEWMSLSQSFMVDASSTNTEGLSQQYLAMVVKDGLCDAFRETSGGERPNVDRSSPDVRVFAKVESGRLWLSVDTSGRPLHQRGYRKESKHEAPLKEQVAAGLLAIAGWQRFCFFIQRETLDQNHGAFCIEREVDSLADESKRRIPKSLPLSGFFKDLMCGTGTLPIEAALMLKARFLRLSWDDFALKGLLPFSAQKAIFDECATALKQLELSDAEILERLSKYRAASFEKWFQEKSPENKVTALLPIFASDKDEDACAESLKNARAAGVEGLIEIQTLSLTDISKKERACPGTLLVMNPPYDKRMESDTTNSYAEIGDLLKNCFPDSIAWLISPNQKALKSVGLRPTRNQVVYNGAIEAKFCQFIVYAKKESELPSSS